VSRPEHVPLVIIGGGPAGYTSAIYAARAGLRPVCVEGYASGGQITRSSEIHNFPGYPDGIVGAELADRMRAQAARFGARLVTAQAVNVELAERPFTVDTDQGRYLANAVIVATGAQPRRLGLPAETAYEGRGVCYCAICDGQFFAGRRVAVVGGGDVAAEEALVLSRIAREVVLVHRRTEFRASAANRSALARTPNITILTPQVVTDIIGTEDDGVTGVQLRDLATEATRSVDVDGVFVAIGHQPATALFDRWLKVGEDGFLSTDPFTTATNVPGVFAAGDVVDARYRQAVTAAASGCAAAIDAERWLATCAPTPVPHLESQTRDGRIRAPAG
jgi:thioredoxin reductase (NADPH)